MFNFNWGKKIGVGLDISDSAIELVSLSSHAGKEKLVSLNRVTLPNGVVNHGLIADEKRLSEILKQTFKEAKPIPISEDNIVFGLPERHFYTHNFEVPATLAGNELALRALAHDLALKHIPLAAERQIVFSKGGLILVADRQAVEHWDNFFRKIGLKVVGFDLETIATWRGLRSNHYQKNICLLDLGASTANIAFFNETGIFYTYVSQVAGTHLTEALAREFKIALPEAEALKTKNGLTGARSEVTVILKKELALLVTDLRTTLREMGRRMGKGVELIVLVGGTAKLLGLLEYLNQELGTKTIVPVIPEIFIQAGEHRKLFFAEAHFYLEAVGLGLRAVESGSLSTDPFIPLS